MKILNEEQLRAADQYTIEHEPVSSINLMERAARACAEEIIRMIGDSPDKKNKKQFIVFCGLGNNGGDGLAIARIFNSLKFKVQVYIVWHGEKTSNDFDLNYKRLKKIKTVKIIEVKTTKDLPALFSDKRTFIIDSIFGTGLNRPVDGIAAEVITDINKSGTDVISIDTPSGLSSSPGNSTIIVKASRTLTFQCPKLSFLLPDVGNYTGRLSVLDTGLDQEFIQSQNSPYYFVTPKDIRLILKKRSKFSHKGTYGHSLLVAGSYGKMGAAVLSANGCLHSGTGLLTVHLPSCGTEILQTSLPEAMVNVDAGKKIITGPVKMENYSAIGVGPGIGTEKDTQNMLKLLIQNSSLPLVLDADALNILSENKTWLSFLPKGSILTPHPKEFERLTEKANNGYERLKLQQEFSKRFGVYVVLKGAHTSISSPEGTVFFNSTGNAGMAKGGSGDVLTGIITGLLAQGYLPKQAAIAGVFIHGLAGDFAVEKRGMQAMIAGDITENLGEAFRSFDL